MGLLMRAGYMPKKKKKAVRNPITGKIDHYTNTKTVGLRDPISGKIVKRIPKEIAEKRGLAERTYTLLDRIEDITKQRKKKRGGLF